MNSLNNALSLISALALGLGVVTPCAAQLSGGPGVSIKFYDIVSADGRGTLLGQVMTIPDTIMDDKDKTIPDTIMDDKDKTIPDMIMEVPEGFQAGQEYWYWNTPSQAYPDAFVIVTSYKPVQLSDKVEDYDQFDHLAFDLSDPHPFPKVSAAGDYVEWTYSVLESDRKGNPKDSLTDAWFAFEDGGLGDQFAWARKDIESEYFELDDKEGLLFVAGQLPSPGSLEVVEAK